MCDFPWTLCSEKNLDLPILLEMLDSTNRLISFLALSGIETFETLTSFQFGIPAKLLKRIEVLSPKDFLDGTLSVTKVAFFQNRVAHFSF